MNTNPSHPRPHFAANISVVADLPGEGSSAKRAAFTMVELLAVVAIIGVLVGLLLPSVQSAREAARRQSCMNNLMNTGIAFRTYHHSFSQFPVQLSGTDGSTVVGRDNNRRLSVFVGILPFIDQNGFAASIQQSQAPVSTNQFGMTGMDDYDLMELEEELMFDEFTENEFTNPGQSEDTKPSPKAMWPVGGPEPFQKAYVPWQTEVPTYRCPSDPGVGRPSLGRINYAACMGDGISAINTGPMKSVKGNFVIDPKLQAQTDAAMRGIFVPRTRTRLKDIKDGAAHTILLAEMATDLGDQDCRTAAAACTSEAILRDNPHWGYENNLIDDLRPQFWSVANLITTKTPSAGRGHRWADGMPLFTGVNTILPPNDAVVLSTASEDSSGVFPPSSRHQGGVNICFADGSVRFVSNSIDAGKSSSPTAYVGSPAANQKSSFGIWGAMGTRASAELVLTGEITSG